ncbi:hypothetical protein EXE58_11135 [Nocardioides seonyuensis]|uniref:Thioesterase domain-containing protein n=1 Tax=Nocardioides seonyuensis TaxID=2518371 RepID=A0A4P7IGS2_9ACTN|nr:hotdog domain-containing protein [Nocardioides seonyuensis]QBX55960.1 hypothetical protein EXE58_11135 [Nocardioides seonyuensis]
MRLHEVTIVPSAPDTLFLGGSTRQSEDVIVAEMSVGEHLVGSDGRAAVGALGVLVDNVLGYALMASLPPDTWSISTEIWVDVVGVMPVEGVLVGEATPKQAGSYAVGTVVAADGSPVAECRQRGRRFPGGIPSSSHKSGSGAARHEVLAPIGDFLGFRRERDIDQLVVEHRHCNQRDVLHGGVSLAASEVAATDSRVRSGCELPTASVHIVHARGVPAGSRIDFETTTLHAGRTLWVSQVIGTVDGKVCTTATVTAQE